MARAIAETESGTIRITLADSRRRVLTAPRVSGDSLVAIEQETVDVTLALRDVLVVEEKQANTLSTIGLVVGSVLLVYAVFAVYCAATSECDFGGD